MASREGMSNLFDERLPLRYQRVSYILSIVVAVIGGIAALDWILDIP